MDLLVLAPAADTGLRALWRLLSEQLVVVGFGLLGDVRRIASS